MTQNGNLLHIAANKKCLLLPQLLQLYKDKELCGVYTSVDEQAYHDGPALSRSKIALAAKSAYHMANSEPLAKTKALTFGSAFHCFILERHLFEEKFIVVEKYDGRTKEGKERKKEIEILIEEKGLQAITVEEMDTLENMKNSLLNNPYFSAMLDKSEIELTAYCIDEKSNVFVKARADMKNGSILIDLKSCLDASIQSFQKDMIKYNYDLQAAHYLKTFSQASGEELKDFVFVCCEKVAPFGVAIYHVNQATVEAGTEMRDRLLERIAKYDSCENKTISYDQKIKQIGMAPYGYDIAARIGDL